MKISIPKDQRLSQFHRIYSELRCSAFSTAIGMELTGVAQGEIKSRIQRSHHNCCDQHPDSIDRLAIIGLFDHSCVAAIESQFENEMGMSTLDLRIDFLSNDVGSLITADTRIIAVTDNHALIHADIFNAKGILIATGTTQFLVGKDPGMILNPTPDRSYQPSISDSSLSTTLGVKQEGDTTYYEAENKAVIGYAPANVFHGGAVAYLIATSATRFINASEKNHVLSSMHINFTKPGRGGNKLMATTESIRLGNAASTLLGRCFHEDKKPVAIALLTFSHVA